MEEKSAWPVISNLQNLLMLSAGVVLMSSGLLKMISAAGTARSLHELDPVTELTYGQLYGVAGATELLTGSCLFLCSNAWIKACVLSWTTLSFVTYRVFLAAAGGGKTCSCLGRATDWWPWLAAHEESVTLGLLAFLSFSSGVSLIVQWRMRGEIHPESESRTRGMAHDLERGQRTSELPDAGSHG